MEELINELKKQIACKELKKDVAEIQLRRLEGEIEALQNCLNTVIIINKHNQE